MAPRPYTILGRSVSSLEERESFLIVCEGKETETLYFKAIKREFRAKPITICKSSEGPQAIQVVKTAIKLVEGTSAGTYSQVWCVFDKDNLGEQEFNGAISLALSKGFKVAYSNAAFEVWYLLHFIDIIGAVRHTEYPNLLSPFLPGTYSKAKDYHSVLTPLRSTAINNAENLLSRYSEKDPYNDLPSTTVVDLVKELIRVFGSDILTAHEEA